MGMCVAPDSTIEPGLGSVSSVLRISRTCADGASEGQTFRHETYRSAKNVLCKSLAKKSCVFLSLRNFCHVNGQNLQSISDVLVTQYNKLSANTALILSHIRYCDE